MEVPCDRRRLAQRGDELLVHVVHLDRGEPQPREPGVAPDLAHEPRQVEAGLAVAVAAEVDAGEDDLAVTLLDPAARSRRARPRPRRLREAPRTSGITQNAHEKLQPSWTLTNARTRSSRASPGRSRSRRRRRQRTPASPRSARETTTTFSGRPANASLGGSRRSPSRRRAGACARPRARPCATSTRLARDAARADDGDVGAARRAPRGRRRAAARGSPARRRARPCSRGNRRERRHAATDATRALASHRSAAQPSARRAARRARQPGERRVGRALEVAGGDEPLGTRRAAASSRDGARSVRFATASLGRRERVGERVEQPHLDGDAVRRGVRARRLDGVRIDVHATTGAKPSFAAAIASTPEPQPTSSSEPRGRLEQLEAEPRRRVSARAERAAGSMTTGDGPLGAAPRAGRPRAARPDRPVKRAPPSSQPRSTARRGRRRSLRSRSSRARRCRRRARRLRAVDLLEAFGEQLEHRRARLLARAPGTDDRKRRRPAQRNRAFSRSTNPSSSSYVSSSRRLLELLEQPPLLVREPARHDDVDEHAVVAAAGSLEHGHPLAAEDAHVAGLGARPRSSSSTSPSRVGTVTARRAPPGSSSGRPTRRCRCPRARTADRAHVHEHVDVAGLPAGRARMSFAREPDALAVVDPRRHLDVDVRSSSAGRRRGSSHGSRRSSRRRATRAGLGAHELAEAPARHLLQPARAAARHVAPASCPARRRSPLHVLARDGDLERHGARDARAASTSSISTSAPTSAPRRPRPGRPPNRSSPKNAEKRSLRFPKSKSLGRTRRCAAPRARSGRRARALGVRQHLVRLDDLLESLVRVRRVRDVRVELAGEPAERLLDRRLVRVPRDAEQLVVVAPGRRHQFVLVHAFGEARQLGRGGPHRPDRLLVVHPQRPDQAHRPERAVREAVRRADERELVQRRIAELVADPDERPSRVERLAEQRRAAPAAARAARAAAGTPRARRRGRRRSVRQRRRRRAAAPPRATSSVNAGRRQPRNDRSRARQARILEALAQLPRAELAPRRAAR